MSYLKKNEGLWILHNDKDYCMGLTAEMADTLGEVTFISLPKVGQSVKAGEPLLEIEAEKAVQEFKSPLTGVHGSCLYGKSMLMSLKTYKEIFI